MSLVGIRLKIGVASSLFLGGCLLSFFVGRWSVADSETTPAPSRNVSERSVKAYDSNVLEKSLQVPSDYEVAALRSETNQASLTIPAKIRSQSQLREYAMQIEQLAEFDPRRALRFAEAGETQSIRHALFEAAYRGWGQGDPEAAVRAALNESGVDSRRAIRAAFSGAGVNPSQLITAYDLLDAEGQFESIGKGEVDSYLTRALLENGSFSEAVTVATRVVESGGSAALLREAFSSWARWEPEGAMLAAMEFEDAGQRSVAYEVSLSSWAQTDPGGLVEFAKALPKGDSKDLAFAKALPMWVSSAPLEAADWLANEPVAPELDVGLLALVNHPYLAERRPEVAMEWAEALSDNGLRSNAVARVVRQWAATDRNAAVAYLRETKYMTDVERYELLALFGEQIAYTAEGERVN